ncbi:Fis1 protein [Pichia kluyveri]|uniref:Mitochondrial fission 1 protein n=1 Tax=Pichia kluyveri TaxID=36015 RepID=A0AAV5QZB8_PICKL|nr:Fis1 protein [Pichia kluyveri]
MSASMKKFNEFPSPQEGFIPLSEEQLAILEAQVESEQPVATTQSQFNYGWGLIKSNDNDDVKTGINIITEIFKTTPSRRTECIYYLSLACFKIKEYQEATRYIDTLLTYQPENTNAIKLKKMIENELAKDSLIGFAIISSAVAATVGIASFFMRRNNK